MRRSERPAATTNGRHESPANNSTNNSASPSLTGNDAIRTPSPLLGTEPLPEDDSSHCPYCHKDFRKPRVLDCLHSMCEDCIIAQLEGHLQQKSSAAAAESSRAQNRPLEVELEAPKSVERPTPPGVIRCPICAQESHVGNDVRYVHMMLLDYVRINEAQDGATNGTTERRCRACKSEQAAVAICKQCQSDLCSNCVSAHGNMRMFDEHVVTSYEEMNRRGGPLNRPPVVCPIHSQQCGYLCATCELLVCKACRDVDHLNHNLVEVSDLVITAIRADITKMVEKIETKYMTSMEELNSLPDKSAQLQEQHDMAKYRLESYYEELAKFVEESKQKKMKELDEARQFQESNIDDLYRKMQVNESKIHDSINFTRRLLTQSNGSELLMSRRKVVQQLCNLSHAIPSHGHQVELEFIPIPRQQIEQHLRVLSGKVVGRMIQPSVKEVAPLVGNDMMGSSSSSNRNATTNQQQDDQSVWGRSTFTATVQPTPNLGAIGGERKKNGISNGSAAAGASSSRSLVPTTGEQFGWPPSSNPPEPSTSPPQVQQQQLQQQAVHQQAVMPLMSQQLAAAANVLPPTANTLNIQAEMLKLLATGNLDFNAISNPNQLADLLASAATFNGNMAAAQLWNPTFNPAPPPPQPPPPQHQNIGKMASLATLQNLLAQQNRLGSLAGRPGGQQLFNLGLGGLAATPQAAVNHQIALAAAAAAQGGDPGNGGAGSSSGTQRVSDLKVHSVFGTSQQGSTIRELHCPSGFCLSDNDDILIADTNNHRVVVCGPPHPWKIGRPGTDDGQLCFPRKVISLKGESARYVVLDKGGDGKTRAQIFEGIGEFKKRINMTAIVPRGGIEVSAACAAPNGHLILVDTAGVVYSIDVEAPRVAFWFDASAQLGEASDVAMFENNIYITDFKNHCVQVFSQEGQFIRKMGEPSQTPYPIGIDVSNSGEVLVADTHGNHLHVVVFSAEGQHQHSFTHNEFRLSRCVGLRIAKSGHIVTLCKHNHTLFVFKPLILPTGIPVPTVVSTAPSLINKFS